MKTRLDIRMAELGLAPSRERARTMIMEGNVTIDGTPATKAGMPVSEDAVILVRENAMPFVSRGGFKLQKAMEVFPISLNGVVAADIGASTGGFTDCMLQHGADHVYAIDVGYGQLDWKLRSDKRVSVMERRNARFMEKDWFDRTIQFASIDVSFISLRLILPPLYRLLADGGEVVALIKPQFEAGRAEVGKNGVVRDAKVHENVCAAIIAFAVETGFTVAGLSHSPIKGPKGNIEFLLFLKKFSGKNQIDGTFEAQQIQDVVYAAHMQCIQ